VHYESAAVLDGASGLLKLALGREPGQGALALPCNDRALAGLAAKRHAYITRDRYGAFYVYDISDAGTYVNSSRVPSRAPLKLNDGDVVSLGGPPAVLLRGAVRENPYVILFRRLTEPHEARARGRKRPASDDGAASDHDTVLSAVSCAVCSHPMSDARNLRCGHVFCRSCALTWLFQRATCPTCRAPADAADLRAVVGFAGLSEVAVRQHGSREDIASFRTRRQHEKLSVEPRPREPTRRPEEHPARLAVVHGDRDWVLLRGAVDGVTRLFAVRREELIQH